MSLFSIIFFIIFAVGILGFLYLGYQLVTEKTEKNEYENFEAMNYDEVMYIINKNIELQFYFKYELEYKLKDIVIVSDFEGELRELVKLTLFSFNDNFYKHIDYYHTRESLYDYVVKQTTISLTQFQNKIKPKIQ